jgi:hypothetical protein
VGARRLGKAAVVKTIVESASMWNLVRRNWVSWLASSAVCLLLAGCGVATDRAADRPRTGTISTALKPLTDEPKGGADALKPRGSGRSGDAEFYVSEPGNFRIKFPAEPTTRRRSVQAPNGQLEMNVVQYTAPDQMTYTVIYTDHPAQFIRGADASAFLDGGVRGMTSTGQWRILSQEPISLGAHPGRDVKVEIRNPAAREKSLGRERLFLIGNRFYQVIVAAPESKARPDDFQRFLDTFAVIKDVPVLAHVGSKPSLAAGGPPGAKAEAGSAPPPAVAARPPSPGRPGGPGRNPLMARGAGSRRSRSGAGLAGVRRQPAPGAPSPSNQPTTGGSPRPEEKPAQVSSDRGPNPAKPAEVALEVKYDASRLAERPPTIRGGGDRERFRETAPKGGLLVGARVGYVNAFGGSKVGSIQAIFQTGTSFVQAPRRGAQVALADTVLAQPGYAVGGINTRTGLLLDAFQLVFMKVKGSRLDPNDSYASDWFGDPRGGNPAAVTGGGKFVAGIVGLTNGREINALGLVVAE